MDPRLVVLGSDRFAEVEAVTVKVMGQRFPDRSIDRARTKTTLYRMLSAADCLCVGCEENGGLRSILLTETAELSLWPKSVTRAAIAGVDPQACAMARDHYQAMLAAWRDWACNRKTLVLMACYSDFGLGKCDYELALSDEGFRQTQDHGDAWIYDLAAKRKAESVEFYMAGA